MRRKDVVWGLSMAWCLWSLQAHSSFERCLISMSLIERALTMAYGEAQDSFNSPFHSVSHYGTHLVSDTLQKAKFRQCNNWSHPPKASLRPLRRRYPVRISLLGHLFESNPTSKKSCHQPPGCPPRIDLRNGAALVEAQSVCGRTCRAAPRPVDDG